MIGITDGDTLTALCPSIDAPITLKIRLTEIDAPEKHQAFGQKSKEALSDLCFNQQATLKIKGLDRHQRTLARVECQSQDANLRLVELGLAWAYTQYLKDPTIKQAEEEAKQARRGLWVDDAPTPPWQWRHPKR